MIKKQMLTFLISSPPIRLSSNRRVSMGLTNSRKTAKRLTVSRKKVNYIKIPGDSNGMILMAKILTASRKSHRPIEAFQ